MPRAFRIVRFKFSPHVCGLAEFLHSLNVLTQDLTLCTVASGSLTFHFLMLLPEDPSLQISVTPMWLRRAMDSSGLGSCALPRWSVGIVGPSCCSPAPVNVWQSSSRV